MMKQTNKEFIERPDFVTFCERAGIKPTRRQASKFQMKKGLAWKNRKVGPCPN